MNIYKTTNLINGKIYIGQNSNNDPKYFGSGLLITLSIKKYGINNFKKEIIEECYNKDELNEKEKYWINYFNATNKNIGYNISDGGTGGKLVPIEGKKGKTYEEFYGIDKAKDIKEKLSKAQRGRKNIYINITSQEVGKKISESQKGKKISNDVKDKIRKTINDYYLTEKGIEHRKTISKLNKNRINSVESNIKRSNTLKGKCPKKLDVHPSAKYWYFYDKDNNLCTEILGNRTKTLKELKTNQRRIVIFKDLDECKKYILPSNKDFKVFTKKYYNK